MKSKMKNRPERTLIMKFFYLDESGTGEEPFAIMVGIIVDCQRMRLTKSHWVELLDKFSKLTGKTIREFHTREFYRGNGPWRGIDGNKRNEILHAILDWLIERKHKISFGGIDKGKYFSDCKTNVKLIDLKSLWCSMAFHQMLILQKTHQNQTNNKGNTLFVFDKEMTEEKRFAELVNYPPAWSDQYYKRGKKDEQLNQIIDVPYFGDSEQVHLLQIADIIAYILRLYLEIKSEKAKEQFEGELKQLEQMITKIRIISLSTSSRFPSKGRDEASELFYNYAPEILREI
jgi:hypothetical protein